MKSSKDSSESQSTAGVQSDKASVIKAHLFPLW